MNRQKQVSCEVERLMRLISAEPSVRRVILFGSSASPEAIGDWSDIDLCIIQDTDLRFYDRLAWWIRKLTPEVGLDLLVYTPDEVAEMRTSRFFVEEVEGKGKELYVA